MMDESLRERVVRQVRLEIASGESAPGAMHSVPNLASRLGMSTTPVREALLELTRMGLIEPMRNRGFKVAKPDIAELRHILDLREVLELHAARLVAYKPEKDLGALRDLAKDVARAVEQDDIRLYLEADRAFHLRLLEEAGNPLLTGTVMELRDKMRLLGIASREGLARRVESVAEHDQIIALVEGGKANQLTVLLRQHIRSWEPVLVEALARSQPPALAS